MRASEALPVLALCACGAALAQQQTPAASVMPEVTVTATMSEQEAVTAPASVTIVPREEIERRGATDLLEAVRGAPGITLQPRQVGGRKTFALRGLEGRHTLTLVDGRRISPSDDVVGHSDYQYGWLPMSAIERVEIVRGPMSTLYGSEALGGVLNIITRQPTDRWIASAAVSAGDTLNQDGGGFGRVSVFGAGPLGERIGLRASAEVARFSSIPLEENRFESEIEGRDPASYDLGGTLRLNAQHSLLVDIGNGHEDRFYDTPLGAGSYESRYHIARSRQSVAWRGRFDSWHAQLRAYRSEIDIVNTRTQGVAPTRPQNMSDRVVDGFAALRLGAHMVTFGTEIRDETLKNSGLIGGEDSALHKAVFVQDEFSLAKSLVLTAGVRADHHEIFGNETSPRVYLVWEATPQWVIKGGYGHAFKAPTLKQISPSYVGAEGPHTFLGNADVRPEVADSIELTTDWRNGPLALRGSLFHTKVKDLITYRLLSVTGVRRTYLYDNVNRARITGLEAGFTWTIVPGVDWNTDLTLLRTRDEDTDEALDDRPRRSLASHLDANLGGGWSTRVGLEYTGTQTSAGIDVPSYTLWNAAVTRRIDKTFSVRLGLENIGDVRLLEKSPAFGYAERGRTLSATLRAEI